MSHHDMPLTRREMIGTGAAALAAGAATSYRARGAPADREAAQAPPPGTLVRRGNPHVEPREPGRPGVHYQPIITPNNEALPFTLRDGVKVFHLTAEEVNHEFCPGLEARTWGYNGRTHGPTIEAVEGDRVRIYVTNKLHVPTTVHWHGIILPNGMDGVSALTQPAIPIGETFRYEFTLAQHGTYMYHSHHDTMTQEGMGLTGLFVIHPRDPEAEGIPRVDRDFAILLHEWRIEPGAARPNPFEMLDFNVLTMNGRAFPGTDPLVVKKGEKVRIRLGNLSAMDHHPIHLHGYEFPIVEIDGSRVPESAQTQHVTVHTPVGTTRAFEFDADYPGDWFMHCHMTHHIMNQMGDEFPNMVGTKMRGVDRRVRNLLPGYMSMGRDGMGSMAKMNMRVPENSIPMKSGKGPFGTMTFGGMATIFKVHEGFSDYEAEKGRWYRHPKGTVAGPARPDELKRDGISA